MARTRDPRTGPALLGAAAELFQAHGIGASGMEEIAKAAGVTKPTLYRHFLSKEELLAAYLVQRHEKLDAELATWVKSVEPEERPLAVIGWLCDSLSHPDFKGCAFVRAYAELYDDEQVRKRAKERKRVMLDTIEVACSAAEARDPKALAAELALIIEGATTMAFVTGDHHGATAAARRLARAALIAAQIEHYE